MNKKIKIISAIISLLMLASSFAVITGAAEFRKGNNYISESYAGSVYYDRFRQVPITGDGPTDAIAVALSQLGYQEGDYEDQYDGMHAGSDNFTEYNYNMGDYGGGYGGSYYWCACFVSFCLYQGQCHDQGSISDWCRKNEGDINYVWREVSCQKWVDQLKRFRMFKPSVAYNGNYVPSAGDLIFFTSNNKTSSHIGIVLYTDDTKVYTIEGNTSSASGLDSNGGGVYCKSYALDNTYIFGYGTLPYEKDESVTKIDYSGQNPTEGLYVATTNKYIYINQNSSNYDYLLPKYSMFEITEVVSNELLKGVFTIDGKRVEGYIKNNTDRIIQLSDNANEDKSDKTFKNNAIINATQLYSIKNMKVDAYFVNDVAVSKDAIAVRDGIGFGINGWVGFTSQINSFGYSIDGLDGAIFDAAFSAETEDAIKLEQNGGEYGQRFKIQIDATQLTDGEHTVNFLVKLADGRVCILDTVKVEKNPDATVPENSTEESTEAPTEETTDEVTEQTTEETTDAMTEQTSEEISSEIVSEVVTTDAISGEVQTNEQSKKGCKGGCKSSLSVISVFAVCCAAFTVVKKKKED